MEEKTCQNCGYFTPHYYRMGLSLLKTSCGRCSKEKRRKKEIRVCSDFQFKDIEKDEENLEHAIEKYLKNVSQTLELISLMLDCRKRQDK